MTVSFKVVIPARYASSRLPGKPLQPIAGKPMIQHTWERATKSGADQIIIATDDDRVIDTAIGFGAEVVMTSSEHETGTDRIAEVAKRMAWPSETIIVNVQGDEPLIEPSLIYRVAQDMAGHERAVITTMATAINRIDELFDPHVVKVVLDNDGYALYFSRAPVPWHRDEFNGKQQCQIPAGIPYLRHIGLYAYRKSFLMRYAMLSPTLIEQAESLEQLRALMYGDPVHVCITDAPPGHGVDTPEDLERVRRLLSGEK